MKAIEIDWSKAPEGATHFMPENSENWASWYKKHDGKWMCWLFDGDLKWSEVGYDEDYILNNSIAKQEEWNGTGLPPVGTVCEGRGRLDGEWREVVVLAHRIGRAVVSFTDHERLQWCEADELRPIRTAEQIAADAELEEIARLYAEGGPAAVYDAGYRKVEGDKQ